MEKVYVDTSFWARLFIPYHEDHKKALLLFAELRKKETIFYISPLSLDELWFAIKKYKTKQNLIKRGMVDIGEDIKKSWELVKSQKFIKVIQLKRVVDGIEEAISFIEYNNSGPRDSFHLAIAKSHGIKNILVKDKNFFQVLDNKKNPAKDFNLISF